jgi:hypothetical protein
MRDVLTPNRYWRVSNKYRGPASILSKPDVIFVPQFAMAQIYVAENAGTLQLPNWTAPPSLSKLIPLVRRLYSQYVLPHRDTWALRPVAAILVRDPPRGTAFGSGQYMAYAPELSDCTSACTFVDHLVPLSKLQGIGPEPYGEWAYADAETRVNGQFNSVNTGEIVLLANSRFGYQFGEPYRSQHGTLTSADALVPVAFGYPAASYPSDIQNILGPIVDLFGTLPTGSPVKAIIEAPAIEEFFKSRRP